MEDKIIKLKGEHMTLGDVEALISESLGEAVKSVIAIGYHLKYIRDHKLYQEAGYLDIWSYAHGRYGFSKSTTSRYISRNDKFSKGGNSLILDERYQDYGKAQLQEMLSLDEEQLEQVTPDMTARQIREMKKPKEVQEPCIEIPGQIELQDLLEADAREAEGDLRSDSPAEPDIRSEPEKVVATSQRDEHSSCPPQVTGCRRQEWGTRPEEQQDPAETVVKELADSTVNDTLDTDDAAEDDIVVSGPTESVSDDAGAPEETEEELGQSLLVKTYDKRILEGMIEKCKNELKIMQEYWMQHMPDAYTEHVMQLRAYQNLLAAEAEEEQAEEPIEQPSLPVLKNNDQRKAWLDTYHEWPVWYEVPQAGEVYYRYDLKDGYSLVICEYHTYQEWREQYKKDPEVTRTREYILTPGYHYLYDCQSSRTGMIEHLKEMRKKEKR